MPKWTEALRRLVGTEAFLHGRLLSRRDSADVLINTILYEEHLAVIGLVIAPPSTSATQRPGCVVMRPNITPHEDLSPRRLGLIATLGSGGLLGVAIMVFSMDSCTL